MDQNIKRYIDSEISTLRMTMQRELADLRKRIDAKNNAPPAENIGALIPTENALATPEGRAFSDRLVQVVTKAVGNKIYTKIKNEIDTRVVPQIANMVQFANYEASNDGSIITEYRHAVAADDDVPLLTDGKNRRGMISPHVRLFFEDDE